MIALALRRLGWTILVVWFVATATFAMTTAIPSDPRKARLGPQATPDAIERATELYCYDESALVQYGCWLGNLARGELGESNRSARPVSAILAERVWPTLQLALAAVALALAVGVPLGVIAAVRRGRWPDRATGVLVLLGQSAPPFVTGTVLLYAVAYHAELLPLGGYGDGVLDRLRHLVLPAATLAALGIAYYARLTRAELVTTLEEDYVRTARAKGLPERRVVLRHALVPASGSIVAFVAVDLGVLAGGAVVVEWIFAWPGLGREMLLAILDVDLPVILGITLVTAIAIALANLAGDLLHAWLDPRIREPRA
jgi:peptide/nickel transport system permease protein